MFQPGKWGIGLFFLLPLTMIGFAINVDSVERDLKQRALASISPNAFDQLNVSVEGRDVTVRGHAFSSEQQRKAIHDVEALRGVRLVRDEIDYLPMISPYGLSAELNPERLVLKGQVPNPELREKIVAAAKALAGNRPVIDQLEYASGQAPDYDGLSLNIVNMLKGLTLGTSALSGNDYTLTGQAATSADYQSHMSALTGTKTGVNIIKLALLPPASDKSLWFVTKTGDDIFLNGFVSDIATHDQQLNALKAIPNARIQQDRLEFADAKNAQLANSFEMAAVKAFAHLTDGQISLEGQQASATGVTKADQDPVAVTQALKTALPQGYVWKTFNITSPCPRPYQFSFSNEGKSLSLSGVAPSESLLKDVETKASGQWPAAKLTSTVKIACGLAPQIDYSRTSRLMLDTLSQLQNGSVSFVDDQIRVQGTLPPGVGIVQWSQQIRDRLPAGIKTVQFDLKAPPIEPPVLVPQTMTSQALGTGFRAVYDGGTLTLNGSVANEEEHKEILALVDAVFLNAKIDDQLSVGGVADRSGFAAIKIGLRQLARLKNGELLVAPLSFDLKGRPPYDRASKDIDAQLASDLPQSLKVTTVWSVLPLVTPLTTQQCQEQLSALLNSRPILFQTGKALLHPDSTALLDAIVADAQQCASNHLKIVGYTDTTGNPEANVELSKQRANSVAAYLIKAGMAEAQISTDGRGDADPIASNDTSEGRARNRRIEITVSE